MGNSGGGGVASTGPNYGAGGGGGAGAAGSPGTPTLGGNGGSGAWSTMASAARAAVPLASKATKANAENVSRWEAEWERMTYSCNDRAVLEPAIWGTIVAAPA
jgi:hypothetical protein